MPSERFAAVLSSPALDNSCRTHLRLVRAEHKDAEYICTLRSDEQLNQHLNASSPEVDAQLEWLRQYKSREAAGEEFYFVIVTDGREAGVVRMYDFRNVMGAKSFSWGSWIIPAPRAAGLVTYSALLVYQLGFDNLRFEQAHFDVRLGNTGVIAFHERAGACRIGSTQEDVHFVFSPEAYRALLSSSGERVAVHRRPTG